MRGRLWSRPRPNLGTNVRPPVKFGSPRSPHAQRWCEKRHLWSRKSIHRRARGAIFERLIAGVRRPSSTGSLPSSSSLISASVLACCPAIASRVVGCIGCTDGVYAVGGADLPSKGAGRPLRSRAEREPFSLIVPPRLSTNSSMPAEVISKSLSRVGARSRRPGLRVHRSTCLRPFGLHDRRSDPLHERAGDSPCARRHGPNERARERMQPGGDPGGAGRRGDRRAPRATAVSTQERLGCGRCWRWTGSDLTATKSHLERRFRRLARESPVCRRRRSTIPDRDSRRGDGVRFRLASRAAGGRGGWVGDPSKPQGVPRRPQARSAAAPPRLGDIAIHGS